MSCLHLLLNKYYHAVFLSISPNDHHISYFDWHNTGASEVVEWRREQQQWQRPLP
jgi:hypothetical protein